MSKLRNISGFPEYLPEHRIIEERIISTIRRVYSSHGFAPMETPAVELLSTLSAHGVIDKEIYVLRRAQASEGDDGDGELALHFDLTVPLARYVAQHYANLVFPFRRYCVQKVWRGERPQKGRYRELYQFDIDIIAREELSVACDAEIVTVIAKALDKIGLFRYVLRLNNRKLLLGFYRSLGLGDEAQKATLIAVDKLDKIGEDGVRRELLSIGIGSDTVERVLALARVRVSPDDVAAEIARLGVTDETFMAGVSEMLDLLALVPKDLHPLLRVDLSLARGLAYYTGTVFEVILPDHPEFGSLSGGGRYENLTGHFLKTKLPGVGGSIGVSRMMGLLVDKGLVQADRKCLTDVLVTVYKEEDRPRCLAIADELRSEGLNTEVYFKASKLGKQLEYAVGKAIPYVLFYDAGKGSIEIKDLARRSQETIESVTDWCRTVRSQGDL
jgi:histidyl-tRNA synthetase